MRTCIVSGSMILTSSKLIASPAWTGTSQLATLLRRAEDRPACGSGGAARQYNTGIHVFALFLILVLSTLACSFPIIVRRFPKLPIPNHALFISRHFGTGVLIATAFVHLLPTAYVSLTDPCLPPFWTEVYPAMSGFIAMLSVMTVVTIEMFFAIRGAGHSHHVDFDQLGDGNISSTRPENVRLDSFKRFRQVPIGGYEDDDTSGLLGRDLQSHNGSATPGTSRLMNKPLPQDKPLPQLPSSNEREEEEEEEGDDLDLDELDTLPEDTQPLNGNLNGRKLASRRQHSQQVSFMEPVLDEQHENRMILQCLLLEAGILFHSVFIGMALSVSTGSAFAVLLIAISFHQTFEGLALGSRIASIGSFSTTSLKPWLMSVMYGITTPIGQAIGLAIHGLYDPASETGLLMVGIVNAISSGLLLYAGLVQLLAEDFLSDQSYIDLTGRRRVQACFSVFGGAMLMSLVGAFA